LTKRRGVRGSSARTVFLPLRGMPQPRLKSGRALPFWQRKPCGATVAL
jgi:hypothetical protein